MTKDNIQIISYRYFNIILLPILLFIITYLVFGFYFETNDDFVISLLLKGDLQPQGGIYDLSNFFLVKLVYIYDILYSYYPSLPWYGFSLAVFNLAAAINIFYITDNLLSRYFKKYFITFILICLYFIFVLENNIEINYTRTSFILMGSSLLSIFFMLSKDKTQKVNKYVIINFILLIIALLIRPMAGILSAFILLPVIIFVIIVSGKIKIPLYWIASIYLILLMLYSYTQYIRPAEDKIVIENLLKIANYMDWDFETENNSADLQDSVKKEASKRLFISDPQTINTEFLDKISSPHFFTLNKITIPRIKTAVIYTAYSGYKSYAGMSLMYGIILFILFYTNYKRNRYGLLILMFIQAFFILSIISISVFMKLPDRIAYPLYGIIITSNLILMTYADLNLYKNKLKLYAVIALVLTLAVSFPSMYSRYSNLHKLNTGNSEVFSALDRKYSNTTFLLTQRSFKLLDGQNALTNFDLKNNKIFPVIGWNTILPSYKNAIQRMCGSASMNDFINFLKNRADYVFISNKEFNLFLEKYFRIFYNNEIIFIQKPETPEIFKKHDLYLYSIISN